MSSEFQLLMIGAMYENGGNVAHRFFDGHPQMLVYPFESQLGTRLINDKLSSLFPTKYRWPVFDLEATPSQDYKAIIDEECKVRARTPNVSKFRNMPFDFSDDERCERYQHHVTALGRSRAHNVEAFFRATFETWKDHHLGVETGVFVGYSPIITVDADKILDELPHARFLHIVRNPWSAYADTKKRPVPLSLEDYMLCWNLNQFYALLLLKQFPDRAQIVRAEDVMADPMRSLGAVCQALGLDPAESLEAPSWNGKELESVFPWGTIRETTPDSNRSTAKELSADERAAVRLYAHQYLEIFNYDTFLQGP